MKPAQVLFSSRSILGLAVAGAALLSASSASAQSTTPSFSFQIENDTNSGGDPVFPVTDNLTFTNLQINEVFAGGFSQSILLGSLDTPTLDLFTPSFTSSSPLLSATLTGSIGTGVAQTVNTATTILGPTTPQYVFSNFSANLFGPVPAGTALGSFSLLDANNNITKTVNIEAIAAVPEASTTVSFGLLAALGLGALMVTRRRTASAK